MKTYKALASGLAVAGMLVASVASAQTATTTTSGGAVIPSNTADLAVSIGGSGIMLDATRSSVAIQVSGLPLSIGGSVGGTCTITNAGGNVATVGTSNSVTFNNPITVPAGSSVTLPVTCTGSTPGTYSVSLVTSGIPAIVANTSTSITPRGIGGTSNNDTVAVGTLTIGTNGSGSVTGTTSGTNTGTGSTVTGTVSSGTGGTTTSGSGSAVLGASTGTPNIPNTGAGGALAMNFALLAFAGLAAVSGALVLRRLNR